MDTLFTGQNLIEFDELDSTNSYAMLRLKEESLPEGTLVWAKKQTAGRGQMGNRWQAESGQNLTFSLIMQPVFLAVEKQFYLSKITSLAVYDMLTELVSASRSGIKIKWPNDMMVNGKKVCGILIENILRENRLQSSVIGVGINVNQTLFEGLNATSLSLEEKKQFDLKAVLSLFCCHFEKWYLLLKQGRLEKINESYMEHLYRRDEWARYEAADGTSFTARIEKVEENGLLCLEIMNGEQKKFSFKEIKSL